jgi:DNA polymerase-4
VDDLPTVSETATKLLLATEPDGKRIRLLGVTLSNFGEMAPRQSRMGHPDQLELF